MAATKQESFEGSELKEKSSDGTNIKSEPSSGSEIKLDLSDKTSEIKQEASLSNGSHYDPSESEIKPDDKNPSTSTDSVESKSNTVAEERNPFAYLDRNNFTAEKFKLHIRNLPKYYGISEFRKLLTEKLNLNPTKLKPPRGIRPNRGAPWMYVCFRSEEDRQKGLAAINKFKWKKNVLSASLAEACPDPLVKKRLEKEKKRRLEDEQKDETDPKKMKLEWKSQDEALKRSVVSWWEIPYEKQLKDKENEAIKILRNVNKELLKENPDLSAYLKEQNERFDGLPCEFLGMRYAPGNTEGYRNKCEFSIGLDENQKKTVGFRLGTYAQGTKCVAPIPQDLPNVPQRMKEAVWVFEKYVQDSPLDIFDPETYQGFWHLLTVRVGFAFDHLMLIIQVYSEHVSGEKIAEVEADLKDFYMNREGKACNPTSVLFRTYNRSKPNKYSAYKLIVGQEFILEKLCEQTFEISPEAFFQVNVAGAELLYKCVGDLAEVNKSTTVLDVCCGAGTIGLSLAQNAHQVLGLDVCESSIKDAQKNAVRNNINNCQFYSGPAESIISSVVTRADSENIVAVVDPPRPGLQKKAVEMLRRTKSLNKLVYLSCNPSAKSVISNFVNLCRPTSKTLCHKPFVPVKAVAVDMFPHTRHFELVLYFERSS